MEIVIVSSYKHGECHPSNLCERFLDVGSDMIQLNLEKSLGQSPGGALGPDFSELQARVRERKECHESFLAELQEAVFPFVRQVIDPREPLRSNHDPDEGEHVLVIGVGGSGRGFEAMADTIQPPHENTLFPGENRKSTDTNQYFLLENLDPDESRTILNRLSPENTRCFVISHSGMTLETLASTAIFSQEFGEPFSPELITARPESPLGTFAKNRGWKRHRIPENLCGRYSALSPVGLLPAAALGMDTGSILEGARSVHDHLLDRPVEDNPLCLLAQLLCDQYKKRDRSILVIMPYRKRLASLGNWLHQLIAESLGKKKQESNAERTGIQPVICPGTAGQHGQLQLSMQGPDDRMTLFVSTEYEDQTVKISEETVRDMGDLSSILSGVTPGSLFDTNQRATAETLAEAGRPAMEMHLSGDIHRRTGAFLYFWKATIPLMGRLLGVNPFNQPGIQRGKKRTRHLLESSSRASSQPRSPRTKIGDDNKFQFCIR